MKIISFVAASSNSGKTTLIEKVVRILKGRGLTVAVVKHASKGFELDRPGKDSWRFREAGADAVLLIGPEGYALQKRSSRVPDQDRIRALVGDADIVIREGFKDEPGAKVEVDDDQNVIEEPPPEAAYLSDKNRRVKEETRDTRTNLDKLSKGKASESEKSDDKDSEDVGGEDEKIRQLEKAQASSLERKLLNPTVHDGPTVSASAVPSNGPMMRPLFHEYTPSDTIAISSLGGTKSGSIAA